MRWKVSFSNSVADIFLDRTASALSPAVAKPNLELLLVAEIAEAAPAARIVLLVIFIVFTEHRECFFVAARSSCKPSCNAMPRWAWSNHNPFDRLKNKEDDRNACRKRMNALLGQIVSCHGRHKKK